MPLSSSNTWVGARERPWRGEYIGSGVLAARMSEPRLLLAAARESDGSPTCTPQSEDLAGMESGMLR